MDVNPFVLMDTSILANFLIIFDDICGVKPIKIVELIIKHANGTYMLYEILPIFEKYGLEFVKIIHHVIW